MTAPDSAEAAAQRIDELLAELRSGGDPRAAVVAEELTCCLVQLYGAGLERIAARLGPEQVVDLCADPLVESLLLVHDLHPVDMATRIRRALDRRGRAGGDVEYRGVDDAGVAHLRLAPGGGGCSSSRQAVVHEIEALVRQAAPEVVDVVVEVPAAPPRLFQVGLRPGLKGPVLGRPPVPARVGP
jgi:Fe-S cluster biogenesis protein NfuA